MQKYRSGGVIIAPYILITASLFAPSAHLSTAKWPFMAKNARPPKIHQTVDVSMTFLLTLWGE